MNVKEFLKLSKWFHSKSQHYIMGNWYCYAKRDLASKNKVSEFRRGYALSYIKFMWLCRDGWLY